MNIEVGKIIKAQGIKGEVKLACYLDDSSMLRNVKQIRVGANLYSVVKWRFDGAFCYVLLDGINDRTTAENMRDWTVCAEKEDLVLAPDRYFVSDLLGCKVVLDNGDFVGEVRDVLQYGAADVFVCVCKDKEVSFPFLNDLIVELNIDKREITLKSSRFKEVAVYED